MIKKFENFNRGDIRKIADKLLDKLSAELLIGLVEDNFFGIKSAVDDINNSKIDWSKDVVKSVRERYNMLMKSIKDNYKL